MLPAMLRFYQGMEIRSGPLVWTESTLHTESLAQPQDHVSVCDKACFCYLKEIKERERWAKKHGDVKNQFYLSLIFRSFFFSKNHSNAVLTIEHTSIAQWKDVC